MADETIFERDGAVAVLTFNRPEARNAMTWEMYEALGETCERVDADDSIRVLVLRGAGDRAFVSGTDIRSSWSSRPARTPSATRPGWTRPSGGSISSRSPPSRCSRVTRSAEAC